MKYKGLDICEDNGTIFVEGVRDFNPVHTFECGQCFRWKRQRDGSYTGVAMGRAVNLQFESGVMKIRNTGPEDFKDVWYGYLDLGRDYSHIKERLAKKDDILRRAVEFGWGIRLLRQDLWETLVSFICSTNKRIPMIMKIVESLSECFGGEVRMEGQRHFTFPGPEALSDACASSLQSCGGGYRCKYISGTSKMVREGAVKLKSLRDLPAAEARNRLTLFPGVGEKVADCTLLYSGTRYDVFPTDLWVKRVMEELYFKREASFKEIQSFAAGYFGELAGFAQQYLFFYARENRIGA